ncbi:phosphoribosylglycinamide formyltransferase [Secundilactobacillus yichangensis]|uniref:phosphoribosylglycinamide formyltransferase n=1 Tax=Secundilactobacillus yichangensis TaxID=2799580 RepID=UPI001944A524|nr:phosphoribosylglycinamide formyltransferase [Secundilactobacillus yichangensis]
MKNESRLAVFASGNGTNFEALVNADLPAKICVLVCDQADVPVIERAKRHRIPVIMSVPKKGVRKAERERVLLQDLAPYHVTGLILAGYMRIVGSTLLKAFPRRIINIHPALLPSFPGRQGIEDAYNAGVKVTGVTIHYVDGGVDTGEIIAQEAVYRSDEDTLASLEAKIHQVEHLLYPKTVRQLIEKGVL